MGPQPHPPITAARCGSCNAPIYFATTTNGRPIPLDVEPAAAGNVVVVGGHAVVFAGPNRAGEAYPTKPRYMPHHATCPTVDQHR